MNKNHCVQCAEVLDKAIVFNDKVTLPVCFNEKCPNYGLVQVGIENVGSKNEIKLPKDA